MRKIKRWVCVCGKHSTNSPHGKRVRDAPSERVSSRCQSKGCQVKGCQSAKLQQTAFSARTSTPARDPPGHSEDTPRTAATHTRQVAPLDSEASPHSSSNDSFFIIVPKPGSNKDAVDATAGRPTVAGQQLAESFAAEQPPSTGTPARSSPQLSNLAPEVIEGGVHRPSLKTYDFVRPAYDLPNDALYEEGIETAPDTEGKAQHITALRRKGSSILANDQQRIDSLCSMALSPDNDKRFDDITRLVATIFAAPIALVSLVEQERQWFKSVVGLQVTQTPRSTSFCAWTLLPVNPEVLVVENALEDPRFRDNPLVTGPPHIRFYAGSPLVTSEGHRLGSLCVIDPVPRKFDAESCNLLNNFAEMVVREIEKDKMRVTESIKLQSQTSSLMRAMDAFSEAIMLVDMAEERWTIMFANDAWFLLMNVPREEAIGCDLWTLYQQPHERQEATMAAAQRMVAARQEFTLEVVLRRSSSPDTNPRPRVTVNFRPAANESFGNSPEIGIPGFVPWNTQLPSYFFATVSCAAETAQGTALKRNREPVVDRSNTMSSDSGDKWQPMPVSGREEPFDDVQLGPLLGKGSFGRVFRGRWNGVPVAVKVVESPIVSKAHLGTQQPMFEADRGVALRHPHVVQTFKTHTTLCQAEGRGYQETWLLLELCDKGSLRDAMDRGVFRPVRLGEPGTWVDVPAILATAKEVAAGMSYLHADNILHGDLTASNILLTSATKDDRLFSSKIADFGLSRELIDASMSTGTYGTVTHMPPELLSSGRLSKSADTYAFGVLLWEMFSGQRPWGGMLQMQIIFNITVQKKKLEFPPDTPKFFQDLGRRCMEVEPHLRPSFTRILSELEGVKTTPI